MTEKIKGFEIDPILKIAFDEGNFVSATLSAPVHKADHALKSVIRPVLIQDKHLYQISSHYTSKVLHQNFSLDECQKQITLLLTTHFKQALIQTKEYTYHLLVHKTGKISISRKKTTTLEQLLTHNRAKKHLLPEGTPIPFLIALGITNKAGVVHANKADKFKQINRFLEIVSDVLPALEGKKRLQILDFGCGKAYLTFALYHYLHHMLSYEVALIGLDLKEDVIRECQLLADTLHYTGLHFQRGDINSYASTEKIDLMVSLHACDTATDAALEKAIHCNADVILAVPCCQHELFSQIASPALKPLLQHGILKERIAALATDAARGKLLEILGYSVQIIEFIDMEHTAKNILIRAIKSPKAKTDPKLIDEYRAFTELLRIHPSLETRFPLQKG